jgi:hypothetical protein
MQKFTEEEYHSYRTLHSGMRWIDDTTTPLIDEQGNYYGYKILLFVGNIAFSVPNPYPKYRVENNEWVAEERTYLDIPRYSFVSPVIPAVWGDYFLETLAPMDDSNRFGIYSLKAIDNTDMYLYGFDHLYGISDLVRTLQMVGQSDFMRVLVKLVLSGTIIEGESGYRSSQATIAGVCPMNSTNFGWYAPGEFVEMSLRKDVRYGNWKSSQDHSGSTSPFTDNYPNPY